MTQQAMDLKWSMRIIRRHWIAVSAAVAIGLIAGGAYATVRPSLYKAQALVVLPTSTKDIPTQVVVADSQDVLTGALKRSSLGMTLPALRKQVEVKELTTNILSINTTAKTAAVAERMANAVATSYVSYVTGRDSPGGKVQASQLPPVNTATRTSVPLRTGLLALIGALLGALIGAIAVLAANRSDRKLWKRDELADTLGSPVLASLPVLHPKNSSDWAALLEAYEPNVVHAWRLLKTFDRLFDVSAVRSGRARFSLTVVSLAADRKALALGPQLAVFAAAQGIQTTLVVGPQQEFSTTATLRAAYSAPLQPSKYSGFLQVAVADEPGADHRPKSSLTIVVSVVDDKSSERPRLARTDVTVLGVSAGTATAEQLARLASSAAASGHQLAGILVADPDPADHTTGQLAQVRRPAGRATPTRASRMTTESRR